VFPIIGLSRFTLTAILDFGPKTSLEPREQGRFSNIVSLASSDNGLLKGLRDFRIDPVVAERNKV